MTEGEGGRNRVPPAPRTRRAPTEGDDMTDRTFADRHIGPDTGEQARMLALLGFDSLEAFTEAVVPEVIRWQSALDLPDAADEPAVLKRQAERQASLEARAERARRSPALSAAACRGRKRHSAAAARKLSPPGESA